MAIKKFGAKCITLRLDQIDFLIGQRKSFNLSRFVQAKLDEYKEQLNKMRNE